MHDFIDFFLFLTPLKQDMNVVFIFWLVLQMNDCFKIIQKYQNILMF